MPFSCYLPRGGASNSSMVGPPGPPDHGCFVPFAEWEKTVTVVVSSIAFVIAFTDAFLVRQRIFYQFTMRSSFTFLLLIPGLCVLLRIATRTWGSAPPSTCPAAEYACSINLGATDAALNILGVYVSSDTVENFAKNVLTDITAILRASHPARPLHPPRTRVPAPPPPPTSLAPRSAALSPCLPSPRVGASTRRHVPSPATPPPSLCTCWWERLLVVL